MILKTRILFLIVFFAFSCLFVRGGSFSYKIVVTTPGYQAVRCYDPETVAEGIKRDFRLQSVSIEADTVDERLTQVNLRLGNRNFLFEITSESRVIRLRYDRNRRLFSGMGYNFVETEGVRYESPSFEGVSVAELPSAWQPGIEKKIEDRNLLDENEPDLFILELVIDENGTVGRIEEISGALKQYSQIFIDWIYEEAVRGWEPARRNGVPVRTVAQLIFEI